MTDSQLRLLIGQRLAVGFDGTAIPDEFAQLVRDCKVGNVILFRRNIESFEQIRELNGQLRELVIAQTGLEPYLMLDEECGSVSRLCQIGTTTPCAMAIGATGKVDNAYEVARIIGQELRSTGFNLNLAPVLDVCTISGSANGNRLFSSDPQEVAAFGRAYLRGLSEEGMLATAKHFPGHGDTNVDSHFALPVVNKQREAIEKTELVSFRSAIEAGVHAIMSAHVVYPALDPSGVPATVSRLILTDLLRETLDFQGLILSDGMEMQAVMDLYGIEEGCLRAMQAGVDICLVCHSPMQARMVCDYVFKAVKEGVMSEEDLLTHDARIRTLKACLLPPKGGKEQFGSAGQKKISEVIMKEAVRILNAPDGAPLPRPGRNTVFFGTPGRRSIGACDAEELNAAKLLSQHFGGTYLTLDEARTSRAQEAVIIFSRHEDVDQVLDAYAWFMENGAAVTAVALSDPSPLDELDDDSWHVCAYQYDTLSLKTLVQLLESGE